VAYREFFGVVHGSLRDLIRWRWFGVVNSFVVLALLAYLLSHRLDGGNWRTILANAQPGWILCAVLAAAAVVLASSLRTHDVFQRETGQKLGVASVARLQFISQFMAFAMPISVAVDVVRIGMYRLRFGLPLDVCTRAVIFDRVLGALAIIFAGVLTCALQPLFYHEPLYLVSFQVAMLVAAVLFVGVLVVLSNRAAELRWAPLQLAVRWMSILGCHFGDAGFLVRQAVSAVLYAGSFGLVLLLLSQAFGFAIPTLLIVAFTPLILFVSSLPFLYAGWGGREVITVVTLSGVGGARADEALVLSVAAGLAMLIASLPGAYFWIARPTFRKGAINENAPLPTRSK
jgi:uncharacterized membrane protein YbhN (UPF0104 family)